MVTVVCRTIHNPLSTIYVSSYHRGVIDSKQLLEDLTDAQREAVTYVDGPLLIIAGAGSGKTRVLTRRVAYLVSLGIPASSILAITFTNKAAGEMKQRVSNVLDRPVRDFGKLDQRWPTICTFHSLCLRVLRHYAPLIGLPANFTIYDSSDQTKVVKDALKALDISSTNFSPSVVHGTISNAKNQLLSPVDFSRAAGDFYQRQVARIYTKYQEMLVANNALDFDDLLLRTAHAFREHPDMLKELQERFQYILIDEYQDTNHAQYVIAHALALRHRNICVVGDPDQSIYAWRGADIQNILDFEKDYPDAKVVKLEQNYRSTKTVLAIASKIIANNTQRKDKGLWTENEQGEKAKLFLCQDEHDEANIVTQQLKEAEKAGTSWSDMAIFCRMNSLSRVLEDALRRANVPYVMARGVEFYNRKVIKDVLAYLRVIANPADEVSLTRIVNVPPRGIGDGSVKLMQTHAIAGGTTLFGAMERAASIPELSSRAVNATKAFVELVKSWRKMARSEEALPPSPTYSGERAGERGEGRETSEVVGSSPTDTMFESNASPTADAARPSPQPSPRRTGEREFEFAQSTDHPERGPLVRLMEDVVRRSGLEAALKKAQAVSGSDDEGNDPLANVNELISSAAEFENENPEGTLTDYLAQVSLVSDADHMKGHGGAVTMMTLHAAKGLEFPVVAMIGLEEGVLPHS